MGTEACYDTPLLQNLAGACLQIVTVSEEIFGYTDVQSYDSTSYYAQATETLPNTIYSTQVNDYFTTNVQTFVCDVQWHYFIAYD